MNRSSLLLFLTYFTLCLAGFFSVRLLLFGTVAQDSYNSQYPLGEDFTNMELHVSKRVPFLKLHHISSLPQDTITSTGSEKKESSELEDSFYSQYDKRNYEMYVFPDEYLEVFSWRNVMSDIDIFLQTSLAQKYLSSLRLLFFQDENDTRGRMRDKNIYLYSLERLSDNEILSVFIHEFWHYYDIYGLPRTRFGDISDRFYKISWESIDVLQAWQWVEDFVSGYAMTNQYEDFAESYTYYLLHNAAFREKSLHNPVLSQKYAFFEQYSFPQKEFYKRNFSTDTRILPYYWDITKIEIEREKFLQYLKIYL